MNNKPLPGIKFNQNGDAVIALWSPYAKKAEIMINAKSKLPLVKTDFDYWTAVTDQLKPGDRYKFLIDENRQLPDAASFAQPDGVHGASMAIDLTNFEWNDSSWKNPPLDNYIIYELHTGTFTARGDFAAVAGKIDHLKALGITAIEIMPVAQFPGDRNWGYDGTYPNAVQHSYGGPKALMKLVDVCHQNGIAVILDVVYNHFGPEGNYFNEYGPYFTDKYHTPWGRALNFDDAWCDEVRHYFIANALMWFRDFHMDALRLDAVHAIKDFSPKHILQEIKENVDQLVAITGKQYHLIAELDLNDTRFINPPDQGGYGLDAQWIDEFHHALRVTAGGDKSSYYADFNGISDLAKSYNSAYVYDGIYSPHRLKVFGTQAKDNPGNQFVVFSQNHDQVGNRMLGERSSQLFSFGMQKLMAGAVLVSPFIPMLFMGEEWAATSPFQYFVSHTDADLVAAVRKGRKAEFAAFHGEGEAPDPQSTETFERSKLPWHLLGEDRHKIMLDYYQTLISLRKLLPALAKLNRKHLKTTVDEQNQVLLLQRWDEAVIVCCLMNFSGEQQLINLPADLKQEKIFDSADIRWDGPGAYDTHIQPQSIIIYINNYV